MELHKKKCTSVYVLWLYVYAVICIIPRLSLYYYEKEKASAFALSGIIVEKLKKENNEI
jgi:hypothetical protein